jgi:hypothetical protein
VCKALPANCEQLLNEHRGGKTFVGLKKKKKLFLGKHSTTGTTNLSTSQIQIPIDPQVFQNQQF